MRDRHRLHGGSILRVHASRPEGEAQCREELYVRYNGEHRQCRAWHTRHYDLLGDTMAAVVMTVVVTGVFYCHIVENVVQSSIGSTGDRA